MTTLKFTPKERKGTARNIQFRPAAWAKLCDLQEHFTRQAGRHIRKTEILEWCLDHLDRLEGMSNADDVQGYHGNR